MAMRYAFLLRSGLAASTALHASVAFATPAAAPFTGTTYLAAGSLLLTMGALAGLLVANRSLRRELDRIRAHGLTTYRDHSAVTM